MSELQAEVAFDLPLNRTYTYRWSGDLVPGVRVKAPFGKRQLEGVVVSVSPLGENSPVTLKFLDKVVDKEGILGPYSLDLAKWIGEFTLCTWGSALAAMVPSARREKSLDLEEEIDPKALPLRELSDEQKLALDTVISQSGPLFYLQGMTGSGKTEVFLQAAKHFLALGKSVIYLVPEISLTHQLVDELRSRLGDLALLHSSLTPSQRLKEWMRVKKGQVRLVVGARSAIFAPVSDLGLIILDEEHESTYKSGAVPRYHARQVVQHLAKISGAKVIMGSATPSLEARQMMAEGRIQKLVLTRRLAGGAPPVIKILDVRNEKTLLSQELVKRIRGVKDEGRQSLLFLNRRGFSYFFQCKSCGHEMTCRQCSVSLTYHKSKNALVCHYCGYQTAPVRVCPSCGSLDVGFAGSGTEQIEEEIQRLFPDFRIARLDADTTEEKGRMAKVLGAFARKELDLLVGTQMVAKGLNFPGVKLVGLVNADMGLSLPDFRASERTFNLITQVAGRAGRFHPDGEVLIQTFRPEHPAIKMAALGLEEEFFAKEREMRMILGFPPALRLIRIVLRSKDPQKAQEAAGNLASALGASHVPGVEVLGPAECPLAVVSGNYRHQILLKAQDFRPLHALGKRAWEEYKVPHGVYAEWDVDPVNLM